MALHRHIARLSAASIAAQIEAIAGAGADQGDPALAPRRANLHRQLAAWSPKRRRVGGIAILDEEGRPILDSEQAAEAVCAHWAGVFAARSSNK
eukprot:9815158-Heterocapsa_arctica.AAC.1